jgi:hypothetical protein
LRQSAKHQSQPNHRADAGHPAHVVELQNQRSQPKPAKPTTAGLPSFCSAIVLNLMDEFFQACGALSPPSGRQRPMQPTTKYRRDFSDKQKNLFLSQ